MGVRRSLAVVLIAGLAWEAAADMRVRKPILAGTWYPADAQQLFTAVREYTQKAPAYEAPGKLMACIVPPDRMSVVVASQRGCINSLNPTNTTGIIVLTASHYADFHGCSIASVSFYETSLGAIPLDIESIQALTRNPLIESRSVSYDQRLYRTGERVPLHEREHGIEAVLPYLQVQNGAFLLVPMIVGNLKTYSGEPDTAAIESVAEKLRPLLGPRTLVVVSTDFTRYGGDKGYRPFTEDVAHNIELLDLEAYRYVIERDVPGFLAYLKRTRNPIDGAMALAILMRLLPNYTIGELIDNVATCSITGDMNNSVSYGALGFFEPITAPTPPAATHAKEEQPAQEAPDAGN